MNSRREFREIIEISREGSAQKSLLRKLFRALRLFIFFFLFSNDAYSQNNLGNRQYDINDPRNPDCPCHKLQKLADDEYNKIQNSDNQQQFALNLNVKISNKIEYNSNQVENNFQPRENIFNQADNANNDNSSHQLRREFSAHKSNFLTGANYSGSKTKKKKSGIWLRKKVYKAKIRNSRIKKVRTNYSVCYKW